MRRPIDWDAIAAAAPAEPFDWTPPDKSVKRPGGEQRGNSTDRRRRKRWLLRTFGDGEKCQCAHCGAWLTFETLTVDRIVPGEQGGTYRYANCQPSCATCAHRQGAELTNGKKVLDASAPSD